MAEYGDSIVLDIMADLMFMFLLLWTGSCFSVTCFVILRAFCMTLNFGKTWDELSCSAFAEESSLSIICFVRVIFASLLAIFACLDVTQYGHSKKTAFFQALQANIGFLGFPNSNYILKNTSGRHSRLFENKSNVRGNIRFWAGENQITFSN